MIKGKRSEMEKGKCGEGRNKGTNLQGKTGKRGKIGMGKGKGVRGKEKRELNPQL